MLQAIQNGIAKVNIGTEIRQTYEQALRKSNNVSVAQDAVFKHTRYLISEYFEIAGTRDKIIGED